MFYSTVRLHATRTPLRTTGPVPTPQVPTREEIARLAYSYWEARGRTHGSPWEDWFRAERELSRRMMAPVRPGE